MLNLFQHLNRTSQTLKQVQGDDSGNYNIWLIYNNLKLKVIQLNYIFL